MSAGTNNDLEYRIAESQGNWPAVAHDQETVSTSGTAVQVNGGTSLAVPDGAGVVLRADSDNTGDVYVGDDTVSASNGLPLGPGDGVGLNVTDVSTLYVDADTDGNSVAWIVEVN